MLTLSEYNLLIDSYPISRQDLREIKKSQELSPERYMVIAESFDRYLKTLEGFIGSKDCGHSLKKAYNATLEIHLSLFTENYFPQNRYNRIYELRKKIIKIYDTSCSI